MHRRAGLLPKGLYLSKGYIMLYECRHVCSSLPNFYGHARSGNTFGPRIVARNVAHVQRLSRPLYVYVRYLQFAKCEITTMCYAGCLCNLCYVPSVLHRHLTGIGGRVSRSLRPMAWRGLGGRRSPLQRLLFFDCDRLGYVVLLRCDRTLSSC